jgi:hypothetical protein
MEFWVVGLCLLLLAIHSAQQFRCWPEHAPISEVEGRTFRQYCFGRAGHYVLLASGYFLLNTALYLGLLGLAALAGVAMNATTPWLLLVLTIVLPTLPGFSRLHNELRYQLQRYVFRPTLPSSAEAHLWRQLCRQRDRVEPHIKVTTPALRVTPEPPTAERCNLRWQRLLFISAELNRMLEQDSTPWRQEELGELAAVVREKIAALQHCNREALQDEELLELLLGCCYLAIARLILHDFHTRASRRAVLYRFGLRLEDGSG